MKGIRKSAGAGGVLAAVVALAAPAALAAQQSYAQCGTDGGQACYGAQLSLSGSTLTVLLQNNGPAPSRITGFGLFDLLAANGLFGFTSVQSAYYADGALQAGLPAGFVVQTGEPSGLSTGATPTFQYAANFGAGGITPCAGTNGGSGTNLQTCSTNVFTEALQLTFSGVTGIASASELGLAVRFQSVANANGQGDGGSLRCLSNLGQTGNCVNVPGGGLQGGGLTGGGTGAVVPEPSTYVLLATGLGALGMVARRRRQG